MKLSSPKSTVVVGLLLTSHVGFVISQTGNPSTTAQCHDDFEWMYNSKDQSPCLVAAYLQSTCFTNGVWVVSKLGPGELYTPPGSTEVNPCQCNTITYNMLSACAACQKHGWVGFRTWVSSCPEGVVQVGSYPFRIQSQTAVPQWAFLDTSAGMFDVNAAYHVALNTTADFVDGSPAPGGISTGVIVAIVVVCMLVVAIPLLYFIFRRKGSLNPWSSRSIDGDNEPVRVQPVRMKSIWLKDDHKYSPIQKVSSRTSPVSLFSPAGKFGRLRPSGRATPVISSERPTSKFEIDKDTVIEAGGGGRSEESAETAPALGGRHYQQPSAGGLSNSSWHSLLRLNGSRPQVEQHEDIGSAVDFTFVSSNANNNANDAAANDLQVGPPSRDPSPTERSPYSYWARNPPHRYPPISRKSTDLSTIYPSDSVSNLQLRENLDQIPSEDEQTPFTLGRPPQGRNTPDVRREVERARREEEARRELAALEVMSPLDTESSIHTEKYSPPPHRSRLPQMPSSDPVMMYPGTVRGNVSHTPPVSR